MPKRGRQTASNDEVSVEDLQEELARVNLERTKVEGDEGALRASIPGLS